VQNGREVQNLLELRKKKQKTEIVLDEEDLYIERLLLEGEKEEDIIAGISPKRKFLDSSRLDDQELTEKDIPDEELGQFIRSSDEVELLKTLRT